MRPIHLLPCVWACAIVFAAQGADSPADAPPEQVVVELFDGSRIVGTPAEDQFKIATQYSSLQIPLSRMRLVELNSTDHTARLELQNGDHLSGELAGVEFAVKAIFGKVAIPLALVSSIRMAGKNESLPEGLVLHYHFDEDEGGRVTDKSGAGNDGTVRGATYTNEGRNGGAMSFNGGGSVVVKNAASLQLQDFTIMAWIKRGSAQGTSADRTSGEVFGYGESGYLLGLDNGGHLFLSKVGVDGVFSQCVVQNDGFHHVAVTKKGNQVVFYLDGVAYHARDYNTNFEFATGVAVGARGDDFSDGFIGMIDEVAVFNRALTDDEVKSVYDSQK